MFIFRFTALASTSFFEISDHLVKVAAIAIEQGTNLCAFSQKQIHAFDEHVEEQVVARL